MIQTYFLVFMSLLGLLTACVCGVCLCFIIVMCSTVSTEDVSTTQCVPEVQRESTQTELEVKEESAQTESLFTAGESCSSLYSLIACFMLHGIWMVIV